MYRSPEFVVGYHAGFNGQPHLSSIHAANDPIGYSEYCHGWLAGHNKQITLLDSTDEGTANATISRIQRLVSQWSKP